jgi:endogenous inhibitor of DNA gyrase (YacG/DUF329 family)
MRNRYYSRSKNYGKTAKCPVCGRVVVTDMFGGYCSSRCVEERVDQNIMDEQDRREAQEDRNERYY